MHRPDDIVTAFARHGIELVERIPEESDNFTWLDSRDDDMVIAIGYDYEVLPIVIENGRELKATAGNANVYMYYLGSDSRMQRHLAEIVRDL